MKSLVAVFAVSALFLVVSSFGGAAADKTFQDCAECPQMVVVPAGTFTMGSSQTEKAWAASHGGSLPSVADEAPQHSVVIKSFAIGKYDVTRGEYAAFVRETSYSDGDGCGPDSFKWKKQAKLSWRTPGFAQTPSDPVVCVSWRDAQAYVAWLNRKLRPLQAVSEHGPYRLPTESEWEYAARAGAPTYFWWGDDASRASTYAWSRDNSAGHTQPVGSKPANAFGLFDSVGNVWQWTEDCYAGSYAGAPVDGRANESGDTCLRVDRGGSWLYPAWLLRSAARDRNPADYPAVIMVFRVARTPPPARDSSLRAWSSAVHRP